LFDQVRPGQTEFSELVASFESHSIDVAFYGGYPAEAGLIVRQSNERLPEIAFVVPDGVASEDFALIAGDAAEGIPMTMYMDAVRHPAAADVVAAFEVDGTEVLGPELYAYAAVQAWAQAAEQAGTFAHDAVAKVLHSDQFDTVLGKIGFDEKGDVTGYDTFVWYVWQEGDYAPAADLRD
jgi:branched-chain amino acid transport system substrate-binding protein